MISCGNCGFQNESGDAFCGSCGTYLEWAAEPAKPVAVSATAGTRPARGGVALAPEPPADFRRAAQVEAEAAVRQEEAARRAAEQAARAKAEAEARAEAEAAARAKAEAEARAKAEEDRKAQEELKRRAAEEAEARRRAEEEAKRMKSAADQARAEAALERRRQAEARIRQEAEARAKEATAARAEADAEARRRAEAESNARREVERQQQQETEARARAEAAGARAATARAAVLVAPQPDVSERPPEVVKGDAPAGKDAPSTPAAKKAAEVDLTDTTATAGRAPTVAARRPEAMKPTAVRRPPAVAKAPPTSEPQMGDLICDQCTEGNLRSRKFCRRCGASLFEAQPYVPPAVAAGERPMLRGGSQSRPRRLVERLRRYAGVAKVAVALLVGVLVLVGPLRSPIKNAVTKATRGRDYIQVRPFNAEGVSTPGHAALLAIDRDTESYWSDGQPWTDDRRGADAKPDLTITFEKETDLDRIGIYSGAGDFDFEKQPRPRALRLEFIGDKYATPQVQHLGPLEDKPAEQLFDLKAKYPVRTIRITIRDVFLALGDQGRNTSLAGFEFFDKR